MYTQRRFWKFDLQWIYCPFKPEPIMYIEATQEPKYYTTILGF